MKAVILARVSSKEQEEGHSIRAQIHRLEEYCARNDLHVIRTFEIIESSTKGDRRKFMDMLKFATTQGETVAVVADKVDRTQRRISEIPLFEGNIASGKIELHFRTEGYVINKESQSHAKLMWGMNVLLAQAYTDSLSDNVKRSIDHKLRNGEWIGPAPVGYKNMTDPNTEKKTVVIDKERAYLVRRVFEEYATGAYSMVMIAKKAREWGLRNKSKSGAPLSRSQIHQMIHNPFYHGEMRVNGQLYPHKYERIIDINLFDKCQQVIKGYNKQPFVYKGKEFIFRGLVKCANCGCAYSGERKKGKYVYMRPTKSKGECDCVPLNEEVFLDEVRKVFKSIQMPRPMLEGIKDELKKMAASKREFHADSIDGVQREFNATQRKLEALLDVRLEGSITRKEYDEKAYKLKQRQHELNAQMERYTKADQRFANTASALFEVASRAYDLFESSEIEQKRQLINFVVPNFAVRGKNLEYSIRKPFDQMAHLGKSEEWLPGPDSNQRPTG